MSFNPYCLCYFDAFGLCFKDDLFCGIGQEWGSPIALGFLLPKKGVSHLTPSSPFARAVISPPPVAGTISYNSTSSSLEQSNAGSSSPACKASSGLEANPGKLLRGVRQGCDLPQELYYLRSAKGRLKPTTVSACPGF